MTKAETRSSLLLITSDKQHFGALGVIDPCIRMPALDWLYESGQQR